MQPSGLQNTNFICPQKPSFDLGYFVLHEPVNRFCIEWRGERNASLSPVLVRLVLFAEFLSFSRSWLYCSCYWTTRALLSLPSLNSGCECHVSRAQFSSWPWFWIAVQNFAEELWRERTSFSGRKMVLSPANRLCKQLMICLLFVFYLQT